MIGDVVQRIAPQLLKPFGIGVDTAAEILVVSGRTASFRRLSERGTAPERHVNRGKTTSACYNRNCYPTGT
ncbi:hypothetical protein [Actinacidiphila glaucinigra]